METSLFMQRFPRFELSYETISHRKVSLSYDICLAVPVGKKAFLWWHNEFCTLMELNKEKRIIRNDPFPLQTGQKHPHTNAILSDTLVYGTIVVNDGRQWFVIEDILFFRGTAVWKFAMKDKFGYLETLMGHLDTNTACKLPAIWRFIANGEEYPSTIPAELVSQIAYAVHHIQYRSTYQIMPFLNVFIKNNKTRYGGVDPPMPVVAAAQNHLLSFTPDFTKPQYKYPTIFQVSADIQFDIYHLHAYGKNKTLVYYNVAYVPNYKTSVFLNGLFRNIRENRNLDYIEESDDEDDFQNTNPDKYVDLNKKLFMVCVFHPRFKKWSPIKVANQYSKIVHINELVHFSKR
jgi:hypothetical protein